ncbi:Os08g0416601 [Oryza sativa Japonica Group]|uniref:Os08g0416601 protein n=1 Tax=Oryza sativa subsp. japonica TaxID=39947 RepID=A0A0P0XFZ8_ORYSJ|nr:Os08g0416601 [Oryza sativa Japonica Group]
MAAVTLRALGNGAPDVTGERRGRDGERRGDERNGPDDERGDFLCGEVRHADDALELLQHDHDRHAAHEPGDRWP